MSAIFFTSFCLTSLRWSMPVSWRNRYFCAITIGIVDYVFTWFSGICCWNFHYQSPKTFGKNLVGCSYLRCSWSFWVLTTFTSFQIFCVYACSLLLWRYFYTRGIHTCNQTFSSQWNADVLHNSVMCELYKMNTSFLFYKFYYYMCHTAML